MKRLRTLVVFAAIVLSSNSYAQGILDPTAFDLEGNPTSSPSCGSHALMIQRDAQLPGYLEQQNNLLEQISSITQSHHKQSGYDERFVIPVVFHIVYNNASENLDDTVIMNQLEILNQCFRRQNPDAANTRAEFLSLVGDAQIEFALATTDPNGIPTTGITRTATSVEYFGGTLPYSQGQTTQISQWVNDSLYRNYFRLANTAEGGIDAWDTTRYLNVWIGDLRIFEPLINNAEELVYFALATPPGNHPNWPTNILQDMGIWDQGVLIHYVNVGSNNPNTFPAPYTTYNNRVRSGKILVHEVGHYLGLRHIWGDGNCTADDFISDTPNANAASSYNCNLSSNTCTDNINGMDLPNMVENYMDYSNGDCQNAFTFGQMDVMRAVIQTYRPDLPEMISLVNLNEGAFANSLDMYPNPSNSDVTIDLGEVTQQINVQVINSLGQPIYSNIFSQTDQLHFKLEASPGVYIVRVRLNDDRVTSLRLVVQ